MCFLAETVGKKGENVLDIKDHKRTGSLFNEMICLRKMDYEEDFLERAEKNERERKNSAIKNDELIRNMFIEEKSYNYGSHKISTLFT